eukprot:1156313-Pyramimonas_sp.AAC.1
MAMKFTRGAGGVAQQGGCLPFYCVIFVTIGMHNASSGSRLGHRFRRARWTWPGKRAMGVGTCRELLDAP